MTKKTKNEEQTTGKTTPLALTKKTKTARTTFKHQNNKCQVPRQKTSAMALDEVPSANSIVVDTILLTRHIRTLNVGGCYFC